MTSCHWGPGGLRCSGPERKALSADLGLSRWGREEGAEALGGLVWDARAARTVVGVSLESPGASSLPASVSRRDFLPSPHASAIPPHTRTHENEREKGRKTKRQREVPLTWGRGHRRRLRLAAGAPAPGSGAPVPPHPTEGLPGPLRGATPRPGRDDPRPSPPAAGRARLPTVISSRFCSTCRTADSRSWKSRSSFIIFASSCRSRVLTLVRQKSPRCDREPEAENAGRRGFSLDGLDSKTRAPGWFRRHPCFRRTPRSPAARQPRSWRQSQRGATGTASLRQLCCSGIKLSCLCSFFFFLLF